MKTSPWFSTETEQEETVKPIHHDNTSCAVGEGIKKNHRRYGTDNRPLCKECAKLDEQGR